ncbi:MAG TPA: GTPase, partial [Phycisphaerae bacterium]|nr:GTPase [Phycisphaerae bacterium]
VSPIRLVDGRPVFCRLVDGEEILDDAVAVRTARGGGVTAEICTHGGVRIAQRMLALVARHGATIVEGLELHRLVSGGDPIEEDVDRALLEVPARRLTHWLLRQRGILPGYLARLDKLDAEELAAFRRRSEVAIRLLAGMRVALIGPPNAGKSTLANRLIGTDRLVISEEPGTTRDWVSETALIDGWPVILTDTAGIRETSCPIETEAIRRGSAEARAADVVVIVLDATVPEEERQAKLDGVIGLISPDQPRIVVVNKCDLSPAPSSAGSSGALAMSALTGEGIAELEARLVGLLGVDELDGGLPTAFLREQLERVGPRRSEQSG